MNKTYAAVLVVFAGLATGCSSGSLNTSSMMSAGTKMVSAYNLSDADVQALSVKACQESDSQEQIAKKGSKYDVRLQRLVKPLKGELNGQTPEFKVYITKDVNAWAMANGCVRVYSGLMDKMTDAELQGVIGHEMGHVALGHSKKAMQTAYAASAARDAAASTGNSVVTALNSSQLGELTEKVINAQFSQTQESAADEYSYQVLKEKKLKPEALVTAFNKLAAMEGGASSSSMLSSHPGSADRAAKIQAMINADKK
jgi:putative metalloprotease